jgi:hypothetical protein
MDKITILKVKTEYENLEPDIFENQKCNKLKVGEISLLVDDKELKSLLEMKYHYFEEGYKCPYTPEELDKRIKLKTKVLYEL